MGIVSNVVPGAGSVADNGVTNAKLRDSAAMSVIGRSANSVGDPADITTSADGEVLRRSGTTLGFGTIATAGIADDAVTYAKLQNVSATSRFLGRISSGAGNAEELTGTQATTLLDAVVGDSGSGGTKGLVPAPASGDAGKVLRGDGTFKYHPIDVAIHAAANTNLTLTTMPAAATFLNGDYRSKTKLDLSTFTQCRIVIQMRGTAGATGAKLVAKYRTTDSTTESDFSDIGTSEVSATIDASNVITTSSWIDLAAGAKADVFVAIIGVDGNGTASPTVGSIHLQFR